MKLKNKIYCDKHQKWGSKHGCEICLVEALAWNRKMSKQRIKEIMQ